MSDENFMRQALALAEEALAAGEFPVACVFVHNNRVVARGSRSGSRGEAANEIDHAEIGALRQFYTTASNYNPRDITAYCTLEPCLMCFGALVIAGVGRIVYAYEDIMGGGTSCRFRYLPDLYKKQRPEVVGHVLRNESLALFQTFFQTPEATYLKGTLLADYTLQQALPGDTPSDAGDSRSSPLQ